MRYRYFNNWALSQVLPATDSSIIYNMVDQTSSSSINIVINKHLHSYILTCTIGAYGLRVGEQNDSLLYICSYSLYPGKENIVSKA